MKRFIFLFTLIFTITNQVWAQNYSQKVYTATIYVDKACNWYNATVGSWISITCLLPELSSKSVCVTGKVIDVVCASNKLVQAITIESPEDMLEELEGELMLLALGSLNGKPNYQVVIKGVEKAKAIWDLRN